MANIAANLGVMCSTQNMVGITCMGNFEAEKTHVAKMANYWNFAHAVYLYDAICAKNQFLTNIIPTEIFSEYCGFFQIC